MTANTILLTVAGAFLLAVGICIGVMLNAAEPDDDRRTVHDDRRSIHARQRRDDALRRCQHTHQWEWN